MNKYAAWFGLFILGGLNGLVLIKSMNFLFPFSSANFELVVRFRHPGVYSSTTQLIGGKLENWKTCVIILPYKRFTPTQVPEVFTDNLRTPERVNLLFIYTLTFPSSTSKVR